MFPFGILLIKRLRGHKLPVKEGSEEEVHSSPKTSKVGWIFSTVTSGLSNFLCIFLAEGYLKVLAHILSPASLPKCAFNFSLLFSITLMFSN